MTFMSLLGTSHWTAKNKTIEVGLVFNNGIGKAVGLNTQWLNKHVTQVPLLQEIKALLLGQTKKPKQHAFLMPLKVRGKVLLVHESHGLLNLALSGSREEQICTLTWFLKELEKDLQTLKQAELDDEPVPPKKPCVEHLPPTWQDLVDSTLESLKGHPAVTGAYWHPIQEELQSQLEGQEELSGVYCQEPQGHRRCAE